MHLPERVQQENSVDRRFVLKGFAKLIVCLLLFLCIAEISSRYLLAFNPNNQASHALQAYFTKVNLAERLNPKEPAIILLGDSHMDFAGISELLRARLKQAAHPAGVLTPSDITESKTAPLAKHYQVVNLASPSVTPDLSLSVLKHAQRSGAPIHLVILNINTRHFNKLALTNPDATIEGNLRHTYEGRCLLEQPASLSAKTTCFFQKQSYLLRYQHVLKTHLDHFTEILFKPDEIQAGNKPNIYPAREVSPMGWAPGYPIFNPEEPTRRHPQASVSHEMVWDEAAMNHFLAYCRQSNIQPVLVMLPVHPRYRHRMPMPPEAFQQRVAHYADRRGVPFWNFFDLFRPLSADGFAVDRHFTDYDHVSVQGALKTTDSLADNVIQFLQVNEPKRQSEPALSFSVEANRVGNLKR